ncbi:MAG: hypothetical protein ACPLQP_08855 [Moorellaceae bacterium]
MKTVMALLGEIERVLLLILSGPEYLKLVLKLKREKSSVGTMPFL